MPPKPKKDYRHFSSSEKYLIITEVEKSQHLWDKSEEGHLNTKLRDQTFAEIAKAFNDPPATGDDVRHQWYNIRTRFTRKGRGEASGASGGRKVKWELWEPLQFLRPATKKRTTTGNVGSSGGDTDESPPRSTPETAPIAGEGGTNPSDSTFASASSHADVTSGLPAPPHSSTSPAAPAHTQPVTVASGSRASSPSVSTPTSRKSQKQGSKRFASPDTGSLLEQALLKRLQTAETDLNIKDPNQLFGESIAGQLSELSEAGRIEARARIQTVISDIQLKELQQRQAVRVTYSALSPRLYPYPTPYPTGQAGDSVPTTFPMTALQQSPHHSLSRYETISPTPLTGGARPPESQMGVMSTPTPSPPQTSATAGFPSFGVGDQPLAQFDYDGIGKGHSYQKL